ncbi:4929_t:CDS:10 [Entrophospora sp. SA101]|nr:4929_t:CDS:10 [Entrophospora sp. SA101]
MSLLKPGEVNLGTTIMAVEFDGGVIIGADTRTSTGNYVVNRTTDKLTKVHDQIFCCRSGSAADTQAIADIVHYHLQMYTAQNGEAPTVQTTAALFQQICYQNKDNISAGIIVAGWDKYKGGSVYIIPLGGALLKQPYAIGGSGSTYIYGYCDSAYRRNMSREEAIEFMRTAIALAVARDGSSGGCIRMAVITEQGVERLFIPGDQDFHNNNNKQQQQQIVGGGGSSLFLQLQNSRQPQSIQPATAFTNNTNVQGLSSTQGSRYQQNPTPHQSPPHQSNTTLNLPHNVLANLDHSTLSSHSPHLLTINLNNNYNDNYDNSIQYSPMPSSSYHQHHHIDSLVNTLHPHHQYSSSGSTPQQPFNLQSIQKVNSSSPFIAANTVQPNPKGLKSQKDSNAVEDAARTLFLSSRLNSDFNFKDNNNNKFLITPTSSFQYDHPLQRDSLDIDEIPNIYTKHNQQQEQQKHGSKDYTDEETIEKQGEIGLIPHNRGHKLKNRAYTIGEKSRLQAPYDIYQDIEYIDTPNNQRCPIIHKFSRNSILKAVECFNDLEFDPYKDINVREKLEDVVRKPHYKRILNDSSLTHCADFLMERIDNEKNFNNVISRLMTVLQGDDTMYPNLDFKLNPPSEIISTRVVKVEEEGGVDLGVLGVGLQGNDRNRDIRVHEAKDQGLETLIAEQISNSNEILRCLIESRNGVLKAIRQRDLLKVKIVSIDKHKKKLEKKELKRNYQETLE